MKYYTLFIIIIHFASLSKAQEINDNIPREELERIHANSVKYYSRIAKLKSSLQMQSQMRVTGTQANQVLFRWPLRVTADYDGIPNYYMIQNYVDDNGSAAVTEYNCGNRSYNGHNGTDINIWPFWWSMMNKGYVQVVAAAPGIVTAVTDNNGNDDNCACSGNNNGISILHADSTTSLYFHIKDNSALVQVNDVVYEGQPIASVGSSGCSSNPHLHFEVRDKNNVLQDPWVGANPANDCNNRNEDTWWQNQKPYWEPQINRVMTHSAPPSLNGFNGNGNFCPNGEAINAKNNFTPGNTVYFGVAMHDWLNNTTVNVAVYYPDGTTLITGSSSNTSGSPASRSYLNYGFVLPANAPSGTYHVTATYQGKDYRHFFTVNCISNYNVTGILAGEHAYIASNTVTSTATLTNSSKVKMQAASVVQFNPGFTATAGTNLTARIKDCNYSE